MQNTLVCVFSCCALTFWPAAREAHAQVAEARSGPSEGGPTHDLTELSKKTQNPVSDLKSIPFQVNYYTGGELEDRTLLYLNFQPVIPLGLTPGWNLIVRTIVPYLDAPLPTDPEIDARPQREAGFGDIQQQVFLTSANSGAFVWGIGPVLSYPVATNDLFRTGDWGIGPTGVVVLDVGPWILGALASQVWTFAGDDAGADLDQFSVQPFINYNLPDGWSIAIAPLISANWAAEAEETWVIPLGAGVSKVLPIGQQLTTLTLQYYHLVEYAAPFGSEQLRIGVNFMFPGKPASK